MSRHVRPFSQLLISVASARRVTLVLAVLAVACAPGREAVQVAAAQASTDRPTLPLAFEPNVGQTRPDVQFVARGSGYTALIRPAGPILLLSRGAAMPPAIVEMAFAGITRDCRLQGLNQLPGHVNYFVGDDPSAWRANVPLFERVRCRASGTEGTERGDESTTRLEHPNSGIDLVYYGNGPRLEYDLIVAPGADPRAVALTFPTADLVVRDPAGALAVTADGVTVHLLPPVVYQGDVHRRFISTQYLVTGRTVRFDVGRYDPTVPLVIDPEIVYSMSFGGSGHDAPQAVAVDGHGHAYVTGYTNSVDFPIRKGLRRSLEGTDVFIAKIDPTGSRLVYATYLGGRNRRPSSQLDETGKAIAVDAEGNVHVTGFTCTTDFPIANAMEPLPLSPTEWDAFVVKINPTGSTLLYSTYLGSRDGRTEGNAIAVSPIGHAYVGGKTTGRQFPTTSDLGAQPQAGKMFVMRLNPAGGRVYSTRLGGTQAQGDVDHLTGLALDGAGNVHLVGTAHSRDFPTVNAPQPACPTSAGDCFAAVVAKLDETGARLVYATFVGGSERDYGSSVAVDAAGVAWITGTTSSRDFPVRNAFQATFGGGGSDVYLAAFSPTGSPISATFLGGAGDEGFFDRDPRVAVDITGTVYVTAFTGSNDFPTLNALTPVHPNGPLFKTWDRARRWTIASRGLSGSIMQLVIDPQNPDILYAATSGASESNVFRTTDAGNSWQALPLNPRPRPFTFWALGIDPSRPSTVYAATQAEGLYKSVDAGASWTLIDRSTPGSGPSPWGLLGRVLVVDPADSNRIYFGALGVRKSVDGGQSWSDSSAGLPRDVFSGRFPAPPSALAIAPGAPQVLYAGYSDGVFRSTDEGATWTNSSAAFFNRPSISALAVNPREPRHVYAGSNEEGLIKTRDSGRSWEGTDLREFIGRDTRFSVSDIVIDDDSPTTVYVAVSLPFGETIVKTDDEGFTWERADEGLTPLTVRALAVGRNRGNTIYAGGALQSLPFLAAFAPPGRSLRYSTYFPEGVPGGLAVDASGNAYLLRGVTLPFSNRPDSRGQEIVVTKISPR